MFIIKYLRRHVFIRMMSVVAGVAILLSASTMSNGTTIESDVASAQHVKFNTSGVTDDSQRARYSRTMRRHQDLGVKHLKLLIHMNRDNAYDKQLGIAVIRASKMLANAGLIIEDVDVVYDSKYSIINFDRVGIKDARVLEMLKAYDNDKTHIHIYYIDHIVPDEENVRVVGMFANSGGYCRRVIVLTSDIDVNTLTHELGHFFGLRHLNDPDNIMHSAAEFDRDRSKSAKFYEWQLNMITRKARKYIDRCVTNS